MNPLSAIDEKIEETIGLVETYMMRQDRNIKDSESILASLDAIMIRTAKYGVSIEMMARLSLCKDELVEQISQGFDDDSSS